MRYRMTFVVGVLGLVVPLMYGQTIDPSTLHIGAGVGTPCAQGCAGEPNLIGSSGTVDIYQQSGGANTINGGSLLLILAVPNGASAPTSPIVETDYDSTGTKTDTGTATLTTTGSLTSGDVYTALGLTGGNSSDSFTNLTCASGSSCASNTAIPTADKNATSFTLYEYTITGSSLVANGYAQLAFNSLSIGTYAFGYGCQGTSTSFSTNCTNNPNPYDTPFTEAGLEDAQTTTPEPTAIILLGSSMIGIGAVVRRRRNRAAKSV